MISTDQLSSTHDHLKIINTSRGSIIDEQALYIYLSTHPQASAMMDVWTEEPNHGPLITALLTLPNMILTPHIGALTIQANQAMHHFNR